jgi:aryl carrier-like protein
MITAFTDDEGASLPTEVLTLCRAELGPTLDWHDDFIDWGAHSIAIARLTQRLQAAGYPVSVRGLLSETRTAAAIADLPTQRDDEQASGGSTTVTHAGIRGALRGCPTNGSFIWIPTLHGTAGHGRDVTEGAAAFDSRIGARHCRP